MATYNGSAWVAPQIQSILEQLSKQDELVVVDDASSDDTLAKIASLGDERIRVVRNDGNLGHVKAFERALRLAQGDVLLLADQDDVWAPGRVERMCTALGSEQAVATRFSLTEAPHLPVGESWESRGHAFFLRNVVGIFMGRRGYFGCAMGLRRSLLASVLPIPSHAESHDLWIALVANVNRSMLHLDDVSVFRRIHGGNLTAASRRPLGAVLKTRVRMAMLTWVALSRSLRRARTIVSV